MAKRKDIDTSTNDLAVMRDRLRSMERRELEYRDRILELEQAANAAEAEVSRLKRERQADSSVTYLNTLKERVRELELKAESFKGMREARDYADQRQERWSTEVENLHRQMETERKGYGKQIDELRKELDVAKTLIKIGNANERKLERLMDEQNIELEQTRKQNRDWAKQVEELKEELALTINQRNATKALAEAHVKEIISLTKELELAKAQTNQVHEMSVLIDGRASYVNAGNLSYIHKELSRLGGFYPNRNMTFNVHEAVEELIKLRSKAGDGTFTLQVDEVVTLKRELAEAGYVQNSVVDAMHFALADRKEYRKRLNEVRDAIGVSPLK